MSVKLPVGLIGNATIFNEAGSMTVPAGNSLSATTTENCVWDTGLVAAACTGTSGVLASINA
ncbi:Uncharacterised protein [Mycobacteroides abscessus subsp. abscessus]|nr:Uncharacterised protein [Mycobacteroides abscessus subsp. abscessus]